MSAQPAAKLKDKVLGSDIHKVTDVITGSTADVPVPFTGELMLQTSTDVLINNAGAAIAGKTVAMAVPPHTPPPGTTFTVPPLNQGTIMIPPSPPRQMVLVNGAPLACNGDKVMTCNVSGPAPTSTILVAGPGNVLVGG